MGSKKAKVTDEHRAESARLKEIWEREKPRLKALGFGTQESFGQEFGIGNQAAVGFFLNGESAISLKAAAAFARGLGCSVSDFSPRLAALMATADQVVGWPFPDIDPKRFSNLSDRQKIELQGVVRERIESFEKSIGAQPVVAHGKQLREAA